MSKCQRCGVDRSKIDSAVMEAALICGDLEANIQTANSLLQRCRSYLARFPVSAYDEHLQREIADYLKRLNDRLSGPQRNRGKNA